MRKKDNPDILGFIDIGLNADNAFNEYVADYAKNGYTDEMQRHRQLLIASATIIITEMRDALSSRAI